MRRAIAIIGILSGIAALVVLGVLNAQLRRDRDIARANERAQADTTRVYKGISSRQGEQLTALSRLLQQSELSNAALGDTLEGLKIALEDRDAKVHALTTLTIEVAALKTRNLTLERDLIALARDSTPWRILHIVDTNAVGIVVDLYVSVPLDTTAAVDVEYADISLPPIPVGHVIGCSKEGDAVVALQGPAWAPVTLRGGTVDPTVCHGQPQSWMARLFAPSLGKMLYLGIGGVAGYGAGKLP